MTNALVSPSRKRSRTGSVPTGSYARGGAARAARRPLGRPRTPRHAASPAPGSCSSCSQADRVDPQLRALGWSSWPSRGQVGSLVGRILDHEEHVHYGLGGVPGTYALTPLPTVTVDTFQHLAFGASTFSTPRPSGFACQLFGPHRD